MDRALLVSGALSAFVAVSLGAFGSHALRARLTPERLARFETGVRYQLWHALAVIAAVFVDAAVRPRSSGSIAPLVLIESSPIASIAGWLFIAGSVGFSGSLYVPALTGNQRWGAVAPVGGACLLLGWLALAWAGWLL